MGSSSQVTAVGVDYGTTSSLLAVAPDPGGPRVVRVPQEPDGPVLDHLPGYLYFPARGRVVVGEVARTLYPLKPHKVVRSVKRDLDGAWTIGRTTYTSADLVRLTLRQLLRVARAEARGPLHSMVLTVPSTFGQAHRRTLMEAAAAADRWVDEVTLLDEPLAAFLAYLDEACAGRCPAPPRRGNVMVFDMGGGTTDISLMHVQGDGLRSFQARVLGVSSDTRLGGDDFDNALAGHLASVWMDGRSIDSGLLTDSERRYLGGQLMVAAEAAKVDLCTGVDRTRVHVEGLPVGPDLVVDVPSTDHAQIVDALILRVRETVRHGLAMARLDPAQVDVVVLAGGMSRCALVRQAVSGLFDRPPVLLADPVTAVVRGACLHHQGLLGATPLVLLEPLRPVLTETMGLRLARGRFLTLLEEGTELPASRTLRGCLTTPHTGCAAIRVPLYATTGGVGSVRRLVATLTLAAEMDLPGGQPVGIEVRADTNKLITVRAFLDCERGPSRTLQVRGL